MRIKEGVYGVEFLFCNVNGRCAFILWKGFSGLGHESQQHPNFAFDTDLPVDVSYVGFHSSRPYTQIPGYTSVSQALADKFCYFTFAGC